MNARPKKHYTEAHEAQHVSENENPVPKLQITGLYKRVCEARFAQHFAIVWGDQR